MLDAIRIETTTTTTTTTTRPVGPQYRETVTDAQRRRFEQRWLSATGYARADDDAAGAFDALVFGREGR